MKMKKCREDDIPIGKALRDISKGESFTVFVGPRGILISDAIEFFQLDEQIEIANNLLKQLNIKLNLSK